MNKDEMVKIVENKEEADRSQKRNRLVKIARTTLLGCAVHDEISHKYFSVSVKSDAGRAVFFIFPEQNTISVYEQLGLGYAVRLAKAYESEKEQEFTIQKCYE